MNTNDLDKIAASIDPTAEDAPGKFEGLEALAEEITATDRDLAVVARIGGNEYRRRLADLVDRRQPISYRELDRWIAQDAESLAEGRSYQVGRYSQPWHYTDTEGGYHESAAAFHGVDSVQSAPRHQTTVPEAAFDWPVYVWGLGLRQALR